MKILVSAGHTNKVGQDRGAAGNGFIEMIGRKFGRLTVIARDPMSYKKCIRWQCECECGNKHVVLGFRLRNGQIRSCGCLQREAASRVGAQSVKCLLGRRFGRLLVVQKAGRTQSGSVKWLCACSCGKPSTASAADLAKGSTLSCGCLRREVARQKADANVTHGLSKTRGYRNYVWNQRKAKKIKATPQWADTEAIKQFYADCPKGFHVDHIIPLQGKLVSGFNVIENLQYLPKLENETKSNKFEPLFISAN